MFLLLITEQTAKIRIIEFIIKWKVYPFTGLHYWTEILFFGFHMIFGFLIDLH